MMRLISNLTGDIKILITGLRPGEKLYEELLIGSAVKETSHARIMTTKETMLPWDSLNAILRDIESACQSFEPKVVRKLLISAPVDFQPSDDLRDILL